MRQEEYVRSAKSRGSSTGKGVMLMDIVFDGSFTGFKSSLCVRQRGNVTLTRDVRSTVSMLLQDVTLPAAAVMRTNAVLAKLVTHSPH